MHSSTANFHKSEQSQHNRCGPTTHILNQCLHLMILRQKLW